MRDLKVIDGRKQNLKPHVGNYAIAVDRLVNGANWGALSAEEAYQSNPDEYRKYLYLMVKICGMLEADEADAETAFSLYSGIIQVLQYITPRDLLLMFPPEKKYDGQKYQEKDYFTTMEAVHELEMDKPIGDEDALLNLLFDYQNHDIDFFMVNWMVSVNRVNQSRGGRDLIEEFFGKEGLSVCTYHREDGYLYNPSTGETTKVKKPKPRMPKYMKLVSS